ncbi:EAL domain-containing protein [Acidovorax sp. HDW3]|uniref:EAL domain-containing protein n=1 Tax=Acidovorax sp. HDW3 TaxID=2714923 RepID=UPI00140750DF|nr:EAL domain-containing protein [Acidovorax sp. HDW3]QIL43238.1 EAL domain-containing protein [Acidovorax sp. HDW3]
MLLELIRGLALLLALCFVHSVGVRFWQHRPLLGRVLTGLLFGGICALGMLQPLQPAPGVLIDPRSVILSMVALFAGPLPATIATAIAAGTRLALGGSGLVAGLAMIFGSYAAGLLYRQARANGWWGVGLWPLLNFGLLLHMAGLGLLYGLAPEGAIPLDAEKVLPYLLTFTFATALLGALMHDAQERLATAQQLADKAARLQALTRSIPDVVLLLNAQGRYLEVLTHHDDHLAVPACDVVGHYLSDYFPPEEAAQFVAQIQRSLAQRQVENFSYQLRTPQGLRHFEGRCQPLDSLVDGQPAVVFIARDRSAEIAAETALRASEQRFRHLLDEVPAISVQGYGADLRVQYWNRASEQLYGYSADEAMGRSLLELIIPADLQTPVRQATSALFSSGQPIPAGELRLHHKNGHPVHVFSSHVGIAAPGQPLMMYCLDIDLSARKAAEERADYLAYYDALTGLPNRRLLLDRLGQAIAAHQRSGLCAALLYLDLDHFKTLNDSRGHAVGDLLLQQVAQRLQSGIRAQDTVARLGGDEFVLLLHSLNANAVEAAAQVRRLGDELLNALRQPYQLASQEHHCSASMGAVLLRDNHTSTEELLQQADLAMYRAKEEGRNTLRFFDPAMQTAVNERLQLQADIHQGLRTQQFVLFYQPQINASGAIIGAEVLLRWQHPERGMVSPALFIPLAEETGQILALGQWVLEQALAQQGHWRHDPQLASLKLSINVSARQFRQADFVAKLQALLRSSGAAPTSITLELTESLLLHDINDVIALMQVLRNLGLHLSLDDFGTGYSSLSYLKRLPLTQVKIDQGFVRGMLHDHKDVAIARSIITLAQELGLSVVAEGVETEAHHQLLQAHGCRQFQGYLFGKPMPLADFEALVRSRDSI